MVTMENNEPNILLRILTVIGKVPIVLLIAGAFLYFLSLSLTEYDLEFGFSGLALWVVATVIIWFRIAWRLVRFRHDLTSAHITMSLVGAWLPWVLVAWAVAANETSGIGSPVGSETPAFFNALTGNIDIFESQSGLANISAVVFVVLARFSFVAVTSSTFSVIVWRLLQTSAPKTSAPAFVARPGQSEADVALVAPTAESPDSDHFERTLLLLAAVVVLTTALRRPCH